MDKLKEALSISGKSRHRDFYAITDLSFTVKPGEILGIMGRNGSGKSTLLKMITGIYEPTSGTISVNGKISSLLELGTGFNIEYTGLENIFFYGTLMGFSKKQMDVKLNDIISFAEIGDYIYQPVKTYSSGMFARLAFSCAINVEPDILIVDEILSVGDMRFQAKCFNKFKEFRDNGVTILYVGHDVGMMRTFCNTAMWINKGKLVAIGDPTYVSAQYTEFMYLDELKEFTDYKLLIPNESEEKKVVTKKETESQAITLLNENTENGLFPESIAHWGTDIGMVKSVTLRNTEGKQGAFTSADKLIIEVCFDVNDKVNLEYFSVAFSIKNTEGTDIVVKTTHDEKIKIRKGNEQKILFELVPRLANGDYYLVIALENRKNASITYYEYIEGVCYFKMYTSKKIFGIYDVVTQIYY